MIILDTNVLSELMKKIPNETVIHWVEDQPRRSLFITAITQAEILYGIARLDPSPRREQLQTAVQALFQEDFEARILPFDRECAVQYASIATDRQKRGRPISTMDAQIAAIARAHGASVATRNTGDFEQCGISIINPWASI